MLPLKSSAQTLSALLLLFLLGCQHNPYLADDEGAPQLAGSLASGHPDNLSLPYAQGTKVTISVYSGGADGATAWKLRSDNPAVLSVDELTSDSSSASILKARCTAVGAGDTVLRLLDQTGSELRVTPVSVVVPDRLRILAHGALRLVEQTPAALTSTEVHEARVLSGSQGVFALVYQRGDQRLYGRGIIQFDPVAELAVTNQTTTSSPVTEWLIIKPGAVGSFTLTLRRGQATLALPVVSVPDSEIGSFGLLSQQLAAPKPKIDQGIWVLLQARDMMGRDIQGVFGSWTLGGVAQVGDGGSSPKTTGDLYRYSYADGEAQELAATRGTLRTAMTVTASRGAIYDTTYLGCGLSGHAPAGTPLAPLGILAALGLVLRLGRRRVGHPGMP